MNKEITFKINGANPESLSQARLAEYLKALSTLYGEQDAIQFSSIKKGSICLCSVVEQGSYSKVLDNVVESLNSCSFSKIALKIGQLLGSDGYRDASILEANGKVLANITGFEKPDPDIIIDKAGSIQGVLRSIEIKKSGDKVKLKIQDPSGDAIDCMTNVEIGLELGSHLLKKVRLHGTGCWISEDGAWKIKDFTASSYKILKPKSWKQISDDFASLNLISDPQSAHEKVIKDRY